MLNEPPAEGVGFRKEVRQASSWSERSPNVTVRIICYLKSTLSINKLLL